ncbi:hypothetical protein EDB85DRAFT_195871 [Lactarius pseudohatsudake]|nr:hypothetical protein EDB85DRAFT_195871 [Lactarius pseudohatsudake]
MSNEPHLPGYSLDDDPQPRPSPPIQSLTASAEPDDAQEPLLNASDTVVATATTPPPIAQPQSLTQQQSFTTQPAPEERPAVDEFADPKIAPLHAIFPDFDAAILYSVVDSVDGDQDRAVDALLSMSDPDHVPSSAGAPAQPPGPATQLDEEFARQLMLEDEQRYARDQIARQQQQQQQQQLRQFPYAQRTTTAGTPQQQARSGSPPSPPSQRERDTMTDVQEQFNKLAESGKRTFSTLVSKVKAKVQEFDQSRNAQNPSPPGAGSAPQQQQHASSGLDRHSQQAYYAPRLQPSPGAEDPTLSSSGSGAPAPHTATDDPTAVPAPPATNTGRPPLSNAIDPGSSNDSTPFCADAQARLTLTGKIGLLPKRPVSLVDTQSQSQQQFQDHQSPSHPPDDSDEELEYVENPFEERHS